MLHPEAPLTLRIILTIHIAAGSVALFVAPFALAVRKGGGWHRRWGMAYVIAMSVVALTAFVCAPYFRDYFFLLIAVFSWYLAFTGWRALAYKRPLARDISPIDRIGASAAVAAGVGMFALGILGRASFGSFSIVLAVFGCICAGAGVRTFYRLQRPPTAKGARLIEHFSNMLAAYIATVTAFSVLNFHFLPLWLRWLWPTIAGTIVITIYNFKYRALMAKPGDPLRSGFPYSSRAS